MKFERLPDEMRVGKDVLSPTAIVNLFESPKHFYSKNILKEIEPTEAMDDGKMIHKAVLEYDEFFNEYAVLDEKENYLNTVEEIKSAIIQSGEKPTTGRKLDLINQLLAINPNAKIWDVYLEEMQLQGKALIKKEKMQRCERIIQEVKNHKWLPNALNGGMVEQRAWWEHDSGVLISMRMDYFHPSMGINKTPVVIDLKKSMSANPDYFSRQIFSKGMFIQAAMYVDGVKKITGQDPIYAWAVVEDMAPYIVECYAADPGTIDAGRAVYHKMIDKYLECKKNNFWPGYTNGSVNNLSIPPWAYEKLDAYADMELEQ